MLSCASVYSFHQFLVCTCAMLCVCFLCILAFKVVFLSVIFSSVTFLLVFVCVCLHVSSFCSVWGQLLCILVFLGLMVLLYFCDFFSVIRHRQPAGTIQR